MIAFMPKNWTKTKINRRQYLMTAEQFRALPPLYSQDGKGFAATAVVKYFCGGLTWLATEFDPGTGLFFGYVINHNDPTGSEWGNFSADDLCSNPDPQITRLQEANSFRVVPAIERDYHFTPCSVREAVKDLTGRPPRLDEPETISPAEAAAIAEFERDEPGDTDSPPAFDARQF